MKNLISLTKKLISIPSFVNQTNNESQLGNLLYYLVKAKYPKLKLTKQFLNKNSPRFNLIAFGSSKPNLLVIGHLDTVQPSSNWPIDPLKPIIKLNRIYGLGAADMKGSLASFLTALDAVYKKINSKKLSLLFYLDEEYDFLGMKKFINSPILFKPKTIYSLDGGLKLSSGCRGLIELKISLIGKSGHSANPQNGINVITESFKLINQLNQKLKKFSNKSLGFSTLNLAYLKAGQATVANVIPNQATLILEIRPSSQSITASWVISVLQTISQQQKLDLKIKNIRHDLKPWLPAKNTYTQPYSGFLDIQMLAEKLKAKAYVLGAGGQNEHAPNEFVTIKNLKKAQQKYQQILLKYCQ